MHIKVLQTLRIFEARGAIDIKVLKDLKRGLSVSESGFTEF